MTENSVILLYNNPANACPYKIILIQPIELYKKNNISPYYFNKRSTFEAHFVKLNQPFNVNLEYTSSIL